MTNTNDDSFGPKRRPLILGWSQRIAQGRAAREGRDAGGKGQEIRGGQGESKVALGGHKGHFKRVGETLRKLGENLVGLDHINHRVIVFVYSPNIPMNIRIFGPR